MSSTIPANWYPDPDDPQQVRYWDGTQWTEHRATAPGAPPPAAGGTRPPKPAEHAKKSKVPLFGARKQARESTAELERLRADMDRLGVLEVSELSRQRDALRADIAHAHEQRQAEIARHEEQIRRLRSVIVDLDDTAGLQEIGLYEFRHPLEDSVAYKGALATLRDEIKTMARKDGGAILASTDWQVNGSAAQGRKMVRDFSKLMLRAYNAEADNAVRAMRPYKLATAIDRLDKVAATIAKLGTTMAIRVSGPYHQLRVKELELTADYQEMLAREKEREKEEKARLREERKVQEEMRRERERLEKEQAHYANALQALRAKGDEEGAARLEAQLGEIQKAIEDVDYRAANIRAGYVYVISNLGSFGERMIKVGLTRRLEPLDRIRELSDASVPFNFDVHALFFSEDAVGIEAQMHQQLADKRVNLVNPRREFFYATPQEARDLLTELAGDLLTFQEVPDAAEYRQSKRSTPVSDDKASGGGVEPG